MGTEELELLHMDQVRAILGVSRTTVYNLMERGFLERADIGVRDVRFRKADVQQLIQTRNEAQPDQYGFRSVTVEGGASDKAGVIRDLQAAFRRADELLKILSNGQGGEPDAR